MQGPTSQNFINKEGFFPQVFTTSGVAGNNVMAYVMMSKSLFSLESS